MTKYDDLTTTYDSISISYDGNYPSFTNPFQVSDKLSWVYVPNFTRSRARYRGTRESYYLNRMISQLVYDFIKLYEKFDALDEQLQENLQSIEWGGGLNATYYWAGYPVESFQYSGDNDLIVRAAKLQQRIAVLEKGI